MMLSSSLLSGGTAGDMSVLSAEPDFSLVREVMYKYSKKSQQDFFESPELCFLFLWFSIHP
jgi:hypothetical protein